MANGMRYVQYQFIVEIKGTSVTMAEDPKVAEEADVSAAFLDGPGAQWPSVGSGSMMLFLEMVLALAPNPRKQLIPISVSMSPVKKDHHYKADSTPTSGCWLFSKHSVLTMQATVYFRFYSRHVATQLEPSICLQKSLLLLHSRTSPTGPDPWFSKGPVAGQLASNNVSMLDSTRRSVKSIKIFQTYVMTQCLEFTNQMSFP